ncbi:hypothetical protein SAMN05444396_102130 [Flavobacterium segetis]|uniref:Uncharacterized protein n=1 Tax=Flavobacterium segetis TaxID=271157 RepID=A0A1M5F4B0_9FLAO|nr:hypothetical protein [Flavobacterium segetis]SHF86354.1 hypothetical protein SAMN05444396_102130 [Flavobacterium segetis]
MSVANFFLRPFRLLKTFTAKSKIVGIRAESNKLIHPRFEISKNALAQKTVPTSLLFLMYSEENDALFI